MPERTKLKWLAGWVGCIVATIVALPHIGVFATVILPVYIIITCVGVDWMKLSSKEA